MEYLLFIVIIIFLVILYHFYYKSESFGALIQLRSKGVDDSYLVNDTDKYLQDYWNDFYPPILNYPWNMPTRLSNRYPIYGMYPHYPYYY
jgi:hypothetical protein